tara:strand:- start:321 stop:554 length:234 start_codon:yes stop_codon:yes gene_type:complete
MDKRLKSRKLNNGEYLVYSIEDIRFAYIVCKVKGGWDVRSQVTGESKLIHCDVNGVEHGSLAKTKRAAIRRVEWLMD